MGGGGGETSDVWLAGEDRIAGCDSVAPVVVGLLDEPCHLAAEDLAAEALSVGSDPSGVERRRLESADGVGQALGCLSIEQGAGLAVDDGVQGATGGVRNDRPPG